MFAYQDPSMFSGRKGAAVAAVALLHMVLVCAFYFGLAQPIIQHFTAPLTLDTILKPQEKVVVQTSALKFDPSKLKYDAPETPSFPSDADTQIRVEPKHADAPSTVVPAPVHEAVVGTTPRMDPKHPLRIGPDYYPSAAIRSAQEGRCVVQVVIAVDGRITDSSLQASSGYPLLDGACLTAVRGQHMLPGTQEGRPTESKMSLPIVWKLTGSR
jgi:periplasmic protein TonB